MRHFLRGRLIAAPTIALEAVAPVADFSVGDDAHIVPWAAGGQSRGRFADRLADRGTVP